MSSLRKMKKMYWRKHKAGGVQLMVGQQDIGYVSPSEDGHAWTGFLNSLYHIKDYSNLKDATADMEKRWGEFLDRISDEIVGN